MSKHTITHSRFSFFLFNEGSLDFLLIIIAVVGVNFLLLLIAAVFVIAGPPQAKSKAEQKVRKPAQAAWGTVWH
jgi:hypothetical protein